MSSITPYSGIAYRYRGFGDFDSESKERIENMFLNTELYFASALKFNDPFECNPAIEYEPSKFRKYLERIAKKNGIKVSSHDISRQMQEYKEFGFQGEYQKFMAEHIGICCMSKKPDIVTQWAYYSKNGEGFCIEYEVDSFEKVGCMEVKYKNSRPIVDIVKFQKEPSYQSKKLLEIISCKATKWAHEEEVRLFSTFIGAASIPKNNIKSVVLGASIEKKRAEWLINIARTHIPSIEIKKATLCNKEFNIKVLPYL
jgi:Protein of unknown function (DUF2971)